MPAIAVGARSPYQNPGDKPSSKIRAEQTPGSSLKKCLRRENSIKKIPRDDTLQELWLATFSCDAEKTAEKNQATLGPQPTLCKKQTGSEWGAVASHPAPESSAQRTRRTAVSFSPELQIIPGFLQTPPANNCTPDTVSGSGRPYRVKKAPSRYGQFQPRSPGLAAWGGAVGGPNCGCRNRAISLIVQMFCSLAAIFGNTYSVRLYSWSTYFTSRI